MRKGEFPDGSRTLRAKIDMASFLPWRNIKDPGLAFRIFLPNIIISLGAAILIPYMNLFFKETYPISDKVLGTLFAISSVASPEIRTMATPPVPVGVAGATMVSCT